MKKRIVCGRVWIPGLVIMILLLLIPAPGFAGELLYEKLMEESLKEEEGALLFAKIKNFARAMDWSEAREEEFQGHLRHVAVEENRTVVAELFLVRKLDSEIYILSVPSGEEMDQETAVLYDNLQNITGDKMNFRVKVMEGLVAGERYTFARFLEAPDRLLLDSIFEIGCTLMLFFIMVGMGLTLTKRNFTLVFVKPKAMMIGALMQWLLVPLVAVGIGYLVGYPESKPFIFMGLVLIMVSPGGTVSNLVTYYAKGDLALSISLTTFSTVLSLFLTPLLLTLYCANVTDAPIPASLIMQIIFGLVIVPLALGVGVNSRWPVLAKKMVPYFSILGIVALFVVIGGGILTNLEIITDTERFGLVEYIVLFGLILLTMLLGMIIPRLFKVSNYQVRALSLEMCLRNAILAMTIAILLQDMVGDFYRSMFAFCAMYGLLMYFGGAVAIPLFRRYFPLETEEEEVSGMTDAKI